jgi:type II pantothenate kinase
MVKTRAADALSSATGAFGKMVLENSILMPDIEKIIITGVGAEKIKSDIFGIPTEKINEITAVGIGGMFQSGSEDIIIANIGTGTVIVEAHRDKISHLGGSGVGGGTILGLGKKLLSLSSFNDIMAACTGGDLSQVDLLIEDIMEGPLGFLGGKATAANFGKVLDTAKQEDIALAIVNMVYQVIGMLSVFAARSKGLSRVVVTGSGSGNVIGKKILESIAEIYGVSFEHPADGQYTTAIGAALSMSAPIIRG